MSRPLRALVGFARRHSLRSVREARGRCLHATLVLGQEARRLKLLDRVRFVRWKVRNDPHYLEHWAMLTDDDEVLDLTDVQVDGTRRVQRQLGDYPTDFGAPSIYPPEPLLDIYAEVCGQAQGERFSRTQLWKLQRQVLALDARAGLERASPRALLRVAAGLAALALRLTRDLWLERLRERAGRLGYSTRLADSPLLRWIEPRLPAPPQQRRRRPRR